MGFFKDIKNLLIGMKITSKHLTRHAVTIQYPEQRDEIPPRSRGIVVLLSDRDILEAVKNIAAANTRLLLFRVRFNVDC